MPSDDVTLIDRQQFIREHERRSSERVVSFQRELDALVLNGDAKPLTDRLEIQLKIEDLIIRSRESEHVKWKVYGPLVLSAGAVAISIASLLCRHC
jgi:hypothetical protein